MLSHGLRRVQRSAGGFPEIASSAQTTSGGSSASSIAVTMPSGIAAGDLLIVVLSHGTSLVTWGTPGGWTALAFGQSNAIFYRIATGSESSTYTFTPSVAGILTASAWRITGSHASAAPEVQSTNSSTSTKNADPPSLTPSWGSAKNLWITVFGVVNNPLSLSFTSYPAGYSLNNTAVSSGTSLSGCHFIAARKLEATTEDPGTYATGGNSGRYLVATIAIRPAA